MREREGTNSISACKGERVTSDPFKPLPGTLDAHLFENPRIGLPLTLFYHMELPIEPFTFRGEVQRTRVSADMIRFPVRDWRAIVNREFTYPVNPKDGYIDGSIYLGHAHNPADITRIALGALTGDTLAAELDITFDFNYEAGAPDWGVFSVMWPVQLRCDPAALDALMKEADRAGARR